MRIGFFKVQIRRNHTALNRQCRLDQPDDARSGFQVAEVGLDRTGQQWHVGLPSPAVHRPKGAGFDRVAEQRAGSVRLDIVDLQWLQAGIGAGGAQHRGLGSRIRRHQTVGAPVLIDRGAANYRQHPVAVTECIRESLEHGDAATLAADEAVGGGVEGMAGASGRHRFGRIETACHDGREDQVHSGSDRQFRLAGAQALTCQVHGDQRRRTRGVDREGWAT